jgi:hypothetical protein
MALRFVLDENLRGRLWQAIQQHNLRGTDLIDTVRVGDPPDLPLGIDDPAILLWAEREGRILVSFDWDTMVGHLKDHLTAGNHSPGVFLVHPDSRIQNLIAFLALAAHAGNETQWSDQVTYIP